MLACFVVLRILRRALWWLVAGFALTHSEFLMLPCVRSFLDFVAGPNPPVPEFVRVMITLFFFLLGIVWNARKYLFLLSQRAFDSRIVKTPHWQNHLVPQIQKEIEAGELVFPSFAESRKLPPQEYMTRMFVAKTHWNDPELRKRQPKLRDSIFKI